MTHLTTPFPLELSFNARRRARWRTDRVIARSGRDEVNQLWSYPLHAYDVPLLNREQATIETLQAYHHAAAGIAHTFDFLDRHDDRTCALSASPAGDDQSLGAATAAQTDFQLVRSYSAGGQTATRKITRPIAGDLIVWVDSVLQVEGTDFDLDPLGVISFGTPMTGGEAVTWGGRYYVPCRFGEDELSQLIHNFNDGYISDVTVLVEEVRE